MATAMICAIEANCINAACEAKMRFRGIPLQVGHSNPYLACVATQSK